MYKKLKKNIRSFDRFGKEVSLNFNEKGERFNTVPGGIITVFISLIVGLYSIYRAYIMLNRVEYSTSSVVQSVDPAD